MKEPVLKKRCTNNHNRGADCEICGDCIRAYQKQVLAYKVFFKEGHKLPKKERAKIDFPRLVEPITYKKIHKSWTKGKSNDYINGADDFRKRSLDVLNKFSVLSNEEVFQHNGTLYFSQRDLEKLLEGLYAKDDIKNIRLNKVIKYITNERKGKRKTK